jgi:hypothetical protein
VFWGVPQNTKWRALDSQSLIWQRLGMEITASSFKLRANAPESRKRFPISKMNNIKNICVAMIVAASAFVEAQGQTLLHQWTFNDAANPGADSVGSANGTLNDGAFLTANGRLSLNATGAYFLSSGLISDVTEAKTLVSWVSLSTLEQGGGSALTIGNFGSPDVFDAIVFGEQVGQVWMNGSDNFNRTFSSGVAETKTNTLVMMAITYDAVGNVSLYRDGVLYSSDTVGSVIDYSSEASVMMGVRHATRIGNVEGLAGEIDEARIYSGALSATEIGNLYTQGATAIPEPSTSVLLASGLSLAAAVMLRRRRT